MVSAVDMNGIKHLETQKKEISRFLTQQKKHTHQCCYIKSSQTTAKYTTTT